MRWPSRSRRKAFRPTIKKHLYLNLIRPTLDAATLPSEKLPWIPCRNRYLMISTMKRLPTQPKMIPQGPFVHLPLDSISTFLHQDWVSWPSYWQLLWIPLSDVVFNAGFTANIYNEHITTPRILDIIFAGPFGCLGFNHDACWKFTNHRSRFNIWCESPSDVFYFMLWDSIFRQFPGRELKLEVLTFWSVSRLWWSNLRYFYKEMMNYSHTYSENLF